MAEVCEGGVLVSEKEAEGLELSPLNRIDGGAVLSLVEAAYLAERGRLTVALDGKPQEFPALYTRFQALDPGFDATYITYRDLRERGFRLETGGKMLRVFPRGGAAGQTPSRYWVRALPEREPLPLGELVGWVRACARQRRELLLSIADEEGELTYYLADEFEPEGGCPRLPADVGSEAAMVGERVVLWDPLAAGRLFDEWFVGKPMGARTSDGGVVLSPQETYHLSLRSRMVVRDPDGRAIPPQELAGRFSAQDPRFEEKYAVYSELRERGLLPKTGYKFGCDFRAYADHPERQPHSPYLVHAVPDDHAFSLWTLASAVRLAQSVRKTMLYAHGHPVIFLRVRRQRL